MFLIELVVFRITVLRAKQFQIGITDNYHLTLLCKRHQNFVGIELSCILKSLIITSEAAYFHTTDTVKIIYLYIKITHDVIGKIIAGKFKKQFVLIDGIRRISYYEREIRIPFGDKYSCVDRITIVENHRAMIPNAADIKLAAMKPTPSLHAIDNHTCHLTDTTLRILAHHFLHIINTTLTVAIVKFTQATDENEFVAVCTQRETGSGKLHIGIHLIEPVSLECIVRGGIKRVLYVYTEARVLLKIRVRKQYCPLALRKLLFQSHKIFTCLTWLSPLRI